MDTSSAVGKMRKSVGDDLATALEPDEPGFGDYANFSDETLEVFLEQSDGDVTRATGFAFQQLAAVYSALGRSIKTDDLSIDSRQRGRDLLEVAKSYFTQADLADAAGGSDFYQIVPGTPMPNVLPLGGGYSFF